VIVEDIEHADVLNPILWEKGLRSLLGVPLLVEQRVVGVLHVGTLHQRYFTQHDVELLQVVADRVALAIDHARLYEAERQARRVAEEASQAVQERDEFLSIAAHELKTPITSLLAWTQLTLRQQRSEQGLDPRRLEERLQTIEQQAGKLGRLVNQLLDLSRLSAGKLPLELAETDAAALVEAVVASFRAQEPDRDFQVRVLARPTVKLDPLRVEQVLANLLNNASKFSPPDQPIEVEVASAEGDGVRLAVRDRGMGIPVERRARIFDRFYQAHADDHRSGMGLGLYVSRQIAELHGGRISAEFPPDGGTRFVVTLPPYPPRSQPALAGPTRTEQPESHAARPRRPGSTPRSAQHS
jgi:signal transduction histidine kinase